MDPDEIDNFCSLSPQDVICQKLVEIGFTEEVENVQMLTHDGWGQWQTKTDGNRSPEWLRWPDSGDLKNSINTRSNHVICSSRVVSTY